MGFFFYISLFRMLNFLCDVQGRETTNQVGRQLLDRVGLTVKEGIRALRVS